MRIRNRIFTKLASECMLKDEAGVIEYVNRRQTEILRQHIDNISPIKAPGEKGGRPDYWMTKLDPKNRKHPHPIYAKTEEELKEKILAHYLEIEEEKKLTVREALLRAVDETSKTGHRSVQRFDKNCSMISSVTISSLNEGIIRVMLDSIIKKKVTKKELNETVSCLNKIADYCSYEHIEVCDIRGIISTFRKVKLVGKHIFKPVEKQTKDLAFSRVEASRIIRYALEHPTYKNLAIAMLIVTGLRVGELLALEVKDVFDNLLWIHQIEDTKSYEVLEYVKENKAREVYLSAEAQRIVSEALRLRLSDSSDSPFLFLNPNSSDGKMHLGAIDSYLRTVIHKTVLGLDGESEPRSAHDLRRTYASLEYLNGTDIYTIRRQLGHSTIAQTEEYIKDVADANERQGKLKGCGLLAVEEAPNPHKTAVFASVRKEETKKEA